MRDFFPKEFNLDGFRNPLPTPSTRFAEESGDELQISVSGAELSATLNVPRNARGLVIFAHGSGSSRHSSRNQYVSKILNESGLATLRTDLLTASEERFDQYTRHLRFDVEMLSQRLIALTDWAVGDLRTQHLPIGFFGASTGAAAALKAAAERSDLVEAIVSRGGRPDLARDVLPTITTATLFIVGGADYGIIELNDYARRLMGGQREMRIIPHATHLFEEPGALKEVADLTRAWFTNHFGSEMTQAVS